MIDRSFEDVRRRVWIIIACWGLAAFGLAATGALRHLPRPLIPGLLFGITFTGLWLHRRRRDLAGFVARMDPRPAIAVHLVRIGFGLAFLSLGASGELPPAFVRVAGPGDVIAGGLALGAIVAAGDLRSRARRALVLGWSAIALADILAVVLTAQRLLLLDRDPRMAAMMARWPFAALPIFVVPLILLTHLAVIARVRRASHEAHARASSTGSENSLPSGG